MEELFSAIFEGILEIIGVSVNSKKKKVLLYIITIIIMLALIFAFALLAEFIVTSFKANFVKTIIIALAVILSVVLLITVIHLISKSRSNKKKQ